MAKLEPVITKELQETVKKNANIQTVYFGEDGSHYFNKHEIELHSEDGKGNSTGVKKVQALPGVKQSVLRVMGPDKVVKSKKVNTGYKAIALEMDRDEILDADVEAAEEPIEKVKAPRARGKKELVEGDNN